MQDNIEHEEGENSESQSLKSMQDRWWRGRSLAERVLFSFWAKNTMRGDVFQGLFPKFATPLFSWCRVVTDDLVLAFWTSKLNVADFYDLVRWKTRQSRGLCIFTRSDYCKPTIKLDWTNCILSVLWFFLYPCANQYFKINHMLYSKIPIVMYLLQNPTSMLHPCYIISNISFLNYRFRSA